MLSEKLFLDLPKVQLEISSSEYSILDSNIFTLGTFYIYSVIFRKKNISVLSLLLRILRLELNKFSDLHMALPCDLSLVYEK